MAQSPRTLRRVLLLVHLWIGLPLCLLLAFIGVTGSILVFAQDIEVYQHPELYRATEGTPRPVGEIVEAARSGADEGSVPAFYSAPAEPGQAASVRFLPKGRSQPGPGGAQVLIDPVTLKLLGARDGMASFARQVERLHANLMIPDRSGRDFVGWLGVAMLALGASGLVLQWPKAGRWKASFQVSRGARGVRLLKEFHGMVGLWGLVVFMIVSFSGVYLAFPQAVSTVVGTVLPARELRTVSNSFKAVPLPQAKPIGPDEAVTLAEGVSAGELRALWFPLRPDQPYRVMLAAPGSREGAPVATVFVDLWSAKVLGTLDPKDYSAGETVLAWQRPLHAGAGLGSIWRILVALSGLMPVVFAATGSTMWFLKRRAKRRWAATLPAARAAE